MYIEACKEAWYEIIYDVKNIGTASLESVEQKMTLIS